jgi:subtilisin family serine protease
MRRTSWTGLSLSAVLCSALLTGCGEQTPTGPGSTQGPAIAPPTYAAAKGPNGESRYLVQFKQKEGADFEAKVRALGGKVSRRDKEIAAALVTGLTASSAGTLRARADVEEVSSDLRAQFIPPRDRLVHSFLRANTTVRPASFDQSGAFFFETYQWNLRRTAAVRAWNQTNAGHGAKVCDLDSGIDPRHIDLKGKVDIKHSTSFVESEPFIRDLHFHGTFTSSIITTNGLGMGSVASGLEKICSVKVLDQTGSGSFGDVISGIVYAANLGVDVINMSLGALLDYNDPDQRAVGVAVQKAINYAYNRGVLVVASNGNEALNLDQIGKVKSVPAQLNHVLSVGATGPVNQQKFDRLASYSNYGLKGTDMVAPGGENLPGITLDEFVLQDLIIGACSEFVAGCEGGDFFAWADGTSAAAPHVTAAAAVIESTLPGDQTPDQLAACLLANADNVGAKVFFGAGRLNVLRAAQCR